MFNSSFFFSGVCTLLFVFACGCQNRPDVSYHTTDFSGAKAYDRRPAPDTKDQLTQSEVLGLAPDKTISEEEIQKTLDTVKALQVKSGSTLLLLQSGAATPDLAMIEALKPHFRVVPATGRRSEILTNAGPNHLNISRYIRLTAAQAGAQTILCYWGTLELARNDLASKTITWLPVVDLFVPDERQQLRIRLKLALLDVRSGAWNLFQSEPREEETFTTGYGRKHEELNRIQRLKARLYQHAVEQLIKPYAQRSN